VDAARRAVEETAKDAGQTVGHAASKAKVPLLAGGAALAGAAGGMVLGTRQARRHGKMATALSRRPQVKLTSRDLASAAKEVGSFGAQMGRLATELQQAREVADGDRRRSPLEVVLEGLTARRSRA
jgi:phage FluMu protein gp41